MPKPQNQRPKSSDSDPLGKLIKVYRPSASAILGLAVLVFLAGGGVLIYCQFHHPYPFKLMLLGSFLLIMAPVLVAINAFNFGRSLEVRKRGVRYLDHGRRSELSWSEIEDVEVNRTDVRNLGVATVWSRRSDLGKPGLLTARTEWEITIRAQDGQTIHLSPIFLQHVPDVRSLITQLKKYSGLE